MMMPECTCVIRDGDLVERCVEAEKLIAEHEVAVRLWENFRQQKPWGGGITAQQSLIERLTKARSAYERHIIAAARRAGS